MCVTLRLVTSSVGPHRQHLRRWLLLIRRWSCRGRLSKSTCHAGPAPDQCAQPAVDCCRGDGETCHNPILCAPRKRRGRAPAAGGRPRGRGLRSVRSRLRMSGGARRLCRGALCMAQRRICRLAHPTPGDQGAAAQPAFPRHLGLAGGGLAPRFGDPAGGLGHDALLGRAGAGPFPDHRAPQDRQEYGEVSGLFGQAQRGGSLGRAPEGHADCLAIAKKYP